jgi:hypothetical protein
MAESIVNLEENAMTRKPMATRKREPSNLLEALDALLCGVAAIGSLIALVIILNWIGGTA